MAIGAKIRCDHCGFVGEMEMTANCKTTVSAPSGWATISPTIRIKGERELKPAQRTELKKKLRELTPAFHVCPECIFGKWNPTLARLLPQATAQAGASA